VNVITKGPGVLLFRSAEPGSAKIIQIIQKHLNYLSEKGLRGKLWTLSIDKREATDFTKTEE